MTDLDVVLAKLDTAISGIDKLNETINGKDGLITTTALNTKAIDNLSEFKAEKAEIAPLKRLLYATFGMILLAVVKVWWPT